MPQLIAAQAGGANVCAFLDLIAWSEGTDNGRQPTKDRGYDVVVGGGLFDSYDDHPRRLISLPALGIKSTAAGRYQILSRISCSAIRSWFSGVKPPTKPSCLR